jgi:hypothetical protein
VQEGVGVDAEGGELELAGEGAAVERFDVHQLVRELVPARVEAVVREGVEHERVVGVGAVPDADELLFLGGNHAKLLRQMRRPVRNKPIEITVILSAAKNLEAR